MVLIFLLSITSVSIAQTEDIKDYSVQKGDTLWDISEKQLNDSFLWPKVWKENPEIANPDKLKPGQTIRIPLYLLKKEARQEEPAIETVIEKEQEMELPAPPIMTAAPARIKPLVDANLFISSGYISESVLEIGRITGSPSGKKLLGTLDMVFIKTAGPVKSGDRFYLIRKGPLLRHPVRKNPVGYLVEIAGVAEVEKFEHGEAYAKILKTYSEISAGDILDTYTRMNPPVVSKPYRKPDLRGYIIAARQLRMNNGTFDIVYIDKGKKDGLEAGDLLKTVDVSGNHKITNGIIQIINVNDTTAVAVARESSDSITRGNLVTKAE